MLSIPDRFDEGKESVQTWLHKVKGEVFTVHRLDEETSGAMIFAKTPEAHARLSQDFEEKRVEKVYLAITKSASQNEGSIEESIAPHPYRKNVYVVDPRGKTSHTDYVVIERLGPFALVEARPLTGRTHQIRVHLQHAGLPLFVDSVYGLSKTFYLSSIKTLKKRPEQERPLMYRSSLHAHTIHFNHPVSGTKMSCEAPLPKDFKASLYQLRKRYGS